MARHGAGRFIMDMQKAAMPACSVLVHKHPYFDSSPRRMLAEFGPHPRSRGYCPPCAFRWNSKYDLPKV